MNSWYIKSLSSVSIYKTLGNDDFSFKERIAFQLTHIKLQFINAKLLVIG